VIDTAEEHGISQLPVLGGQAARPRARGRRAPPPAAGKVTLDSAIEPIIESDYATVTPSTKVELLKGVLGDAKLAVVMDGDTVVGVVTKIDLIDYLTRIAAPQAS
jgi:cystathionine beta-synthase